MIVVFVIGHAIVWVYSIIVYNSAEFDVCKGDEPHYFFLKAYIYVYGILIIGSLVLLALLLIPVAALTIFSGDKKKANSAEDDDE